MIYYKLTKNVSDVFVSQTEGTETAKKLHEGSETDILGLCKRRLDESVSGTSFLICNVKVGVGEPGYFSVPLQPLQCASL